MRESGDVQDTLVSLALFVLIVAAVFAIVLMSVFVYVCIKYRPTPKGIAAMVASFVYAASPVDLLPEVVLGPLGLVDDVGIAAMAITYVIKAAQKRKGNRMRGPIIDTQARDVGQRP